MNITTKYNIWDTVWTVKDNKAYNFKIWYIQINSNEDKNIVNYYESNPYVTDTKNYREEDFVWSREELINLL